MAKRNKNIVELTKACSEILRVSKKYSYLWDNQEILGEDNKEKLLHLFCGFIAQDETFHIYLKKKGNKFVFDGKNFCDDDNGFGAKEAALEMDRLYSNYHGINADELRKSFYESLKEPLGKYLANKCLEKIVYWKKEVKNEISLE